MNVSGGVTPSLLPLAHSIEVMALISWPTSHRARLHGGASDAWQSTTHSGAIRSIVPQPFF